MKRILFILVVVASCCAIATNAQSKPTREVKIPTESGLGVKYVDYFQIERGFFATAEAVGGYSVELNRKNIGFSEIDIVGGYRFGDYLRAGIGLGGRYYIGATQIRTHNWALPLFANLRGNFIPNGYYSVVPFWSVDAGTTFPDGFMIRPTIGIRVGQQRSAFVASIGYMGQNLKIKKYISESGEMFVSDNRHFYNFITLKLGYEF